MWWVLIGAAAGAVHVLSGPDHLAAVAPFATTGGGLRAGALWGFGHGVGVLVLGLLAVAFRGLITLDSVSATSEHVVGFALIGLGVWTLWEARSERPAHGHSHRAVFGMGVLHGAAGASHLIGVLPTLALAPAQGVTYLISFLTGACLTMASVGAGLGRLRAVAPSRWRMVSGLVAIGVGASWVTAT